MILHSLLVMLRDIYLCCILDIVYLRTNSIKIWICFFIAPIFFGGGTRFSAYVQTGPGAHPASYTMCTRSFPGVKRPGHGIDHPLPPSAKVKERVELYLYSPLLAFVVCSRVNRTFTRIFPVLKNVWS